MRAMNIIRSHKHEIVTETVSKIALSLNDDKRVIRDDGIHTFAHGHAALGGQLFESLLNNKMNPENIPFNALIVGPTNSGKKTFLVNLLKTKFIQRFDFIFLLFPTFIHNKTWDGFAENDKDFFVIIPEHHQINDWLRIISFAFEGTNTFIILDDCASSKDVKKRSDELVKLAFSARHSGISGWVLTQ